MTKQEINELANTSYHSDIVPRNETDAYISAFNAGYKAAQKILTEEQLRFIYDTGVHANIGELNHDVEFKRVINFINKTK